jgi:cell division protease FtsH
MFIDEIDALGRRRGAGLGAGHDEREQTLNQLLVEMDGFEPKKGVILLAATNRPDILDPALLRPGRFDRHVIVPMPDLKGREQILRVHLREKPVSDDVDIGVLARAIPGFTGADIENMVNEAILIAVMHDKDIVEMIDFEYAKDKILMGRERKGLLISDEEKRISAYHESGHTLIGELLPDADSVHKVTIIPRAGGIGLTQLLPVKERHSHSKEYLAAKIEVLMGGRAAEEVVLNVKTTGAGKDFEEASELARQMVCDYGMSNDLGPLSYGKQGEEVFLGKEIVRQRDYSEFTARKIDEEVGNILTHASEKARSLVKDNMETVHKLAFALMEKETLKGEEIDDIIHGDFYARQGC